MQVTSVVRITACCNLKMSLTKLLLQVNKSKNMNAFLRIPWTRYNSESLSQSNKRASCIVY